MLTAKPKILIVDDTKSIVAALKNLLRDYETIVAYDGEQGLELARSEKPDLILLDLMLPKVNGYEVCGLLKFDEQYKQIPIILLTSRVGEEIQSEAKRAGADAYLNKPFDNTVLMATIEKLLQDRKDRNDYGR